MGGSTMGGSAMSGGFGSSTGGMAGGKSTGSLADSNPTSTITLDPSMHFYDYGGVSSFSGQIETVQAYDAPNFVSQVVNTPGMNKVLIIDGGGMRPDGGAVFDGDMASAASRNGWKGVIVHGVVRDVQQLQRTQIGVKALGSSPIKGKGAMGQKSAMLNIGGRQIQPGWWVYADGDGVVLSQTDISGGSFGGGGSTMGGSSMMSGGMSGGFGRSPMGGSTMGGSTMGGSTMGGSTMSGGFGSSTGGMAGGFGSSTGGMAGGFGSSTGARSTMGGLSGGYGSSTTGGMSGGGLAGGYGSSSTTGYKSSTMGGGYGSSTMGSSSLYGSGYSPYGSSYGARKKKKKVFKIMLASSIAALVWLLCLR
jgi:regulator of ribonuclease activity A